MQIPCIGGFLIYANFVIMHCDKILHRENQREISSSQKAKRNVYRRWR